MPTRGTSGGSEVEVRLDPKDLGRLLREAKEFAPELAKATRKRLRDVAGEGVTDVRRRLMGRTFHHDTGLASGLAAGTKVSIRTGANTAGVSIVTTGTKLPAGKQPMVRAYNKRTFRHPVFGNRNVWVTQRGRPYFGAVLDERKSSMLQAMEAALREAAETIRTGEVS
jgi:hypothetical protein